jgi:transposase
MSQKGVSDLSVYQVAAAINKNGSSIWQFYKGQPSNLLEDINLDKLLADMQSKLGDRWAESITTSILKEFDNIESLNFEI